MRKLIEMVEFSLMYHPRYKHSVGVMKMAIKLNEIHNLNVDNDAIKLASLLHDVTKTNTNEDNLSIIEKCLNDIIDDELLDSPSIWHAFSGMVVARDQYHIVNEDVLNAIYYHTTGRPNMSNLEKLIFLSDYIEMNRIGKNFEDIRLIAYKNIDQAIISMYENQFEYLENNNRSIYKLSKLAYEYYKKEINDDR